MKSIKLYSTLGCHLCDHAKDIVWPVLRETEYRLVEIDIADSNELMEKFSLSIPVLEHPAHQTFLHWPFNSEDVYTFLMD